MLVDCADPNEHVVLPVGDHRVLPVAGPAPKPPLLALEDRVEGDEEEEEEEGEGEQERDMHERGQGVGRALGQ